MFSIEAIPCLTALPLQARLGLLFLFLPISGFSQRFLSEWGQRWFSLAWTSLVSFPYLSSIPHTALHRASFFFASKTRLPLPLKGEGRGITFLGLVGSALFVQNWVTLAQQVLSAADQLNGRHHRRLATAHLRNSLRRS